MLAVIVSCCMLMVVSAAKQANISGSVFECPNLTDTSPAQSVHQLKPSNIQVVGALGDSISAGFGILANLETYLELKEYRGLAWTAGGNFTLDYVTTLPNIIKKYNPGVVGFSVGITTAFDPSNYANPETGFNLAISGAKADGLMLQATEMVEKMKNDPRVNFTEDWKLITLFIGVNDLCASCVGPCESADDYVAEIERVLDYLQAELPRTLVNLVPTYDVTILADAALDRIHGNFCRFIYTLYCPCGPGSNSLEIIEATSKLAGSYRDGLADLINSGRYNDSETFTVIIQPFFADTDLVVDSNLTVDLSRLAVDCFHFSSKGNRIAAVNLWNNMFQAVGEKTQYYNQAPTIFCPTDDDPYIKTGISHAAPVVVSLVAFCVAVSLGVSVSMN